MCSPWGQQVMILILIFLDRQGIIDEPHSLENAPKCVQISFSPIQNTRFLQQTMDAWGVMGLWGDFDDGTHIDALKCDVIKLLMECKLLGNVNRRNSIIHNSLSCSVSVIPPNRAMFSIQLKLSLDLTLSDTYIFYTITIPKRPLNIILYVAYPCRIVETNYINLRRLMLIINAYILFILVFFLCMLAFLGRISSLYI